MPKLLIKEKEIETEREKAKKKFKKINLGDKVRTNKDYSRNWPYLPVEGMVVGREILPGLEEDMDTTPFIITVQTKSEQTIEVNALWLEKVS